MHSLSAIFSHRLQKTKILAGIVAANIFLLAACLLPSQLNAESKQFNHPATKIEVNGDASLSLKLTRKGESQKPELLELSSPTRLVIDFAGKFAGKNETYNVHGAIIKAVRVGVHPDKLRLVIDLNGASVPAHTLRSNVESFVIEFGSAKSEQKPAEAAKHALPQTSSPLTIPTPLAPVTSPVEKKDPIKHESVTLPTANVEHEKATKQPVATPKILPASTPVELRTISTPEPTPTNAKTKATSPMFVVTPQPTKASQVNIATPTPKKASSTPTPAQTYIPTNSEAEPSPSVTQSNNLNKSVENTQSSPSLAPGLWIKKVTFDYLPPTQTPVAKLELTQVAKFMLKRKDDKLYVLTITDAQLANKNLELAHYPPQDFLGFTLIKAQAKNGDVEVQIGTERGVKLMAYYKDSSIWIRVLNR